MDYIVYTDDRADELRRIREGSKTMLLADVSRLPELAQSVRPGDMLYLTGDGPQGKVEFRCRVRRTEVSEEQKQREAWLSRYQEGLQLTGRQWKQCLKRKNLMLVELQDGEPVEPLRFNRMLFGHGDDWVPVGDIERVKKLTMRR